MLVQKIVIFPVHPGMSCNGNSVNLIEKIVKDILYMFMPGVDKPYCNQKLKIPVAPTKENFFPTTTCVTAEATSMCASDFFSPRKNNE